MKTMTDKVANKVAGTWNKTYRVERGGENDKILLTVDWLSPSIETKVAVKAGEKAKNILRGVGKSLQNRLKDYFGGLMGEFWYITQPSVHVGGTRAVATGCTGSFEWEVGEWWEIMEEAGEDIDNAIDREKEVIEHVKTFLKKEGFDEI